MIQLSSLGSSLTTEKLHCRDPPSLGSGGRFTDGACYMLQQKETLAVIGTCHNNCLYDCVPLYFACGILCLLRRSHQWEPWIRACLHSPLLGRVLVGFQTGGKMTASFPGFFRVGWHDFSLPVCTLVYHGSPEVVKACVPALMARNLIVAVLYYV